MLGGDDVVRIAVTHSGVGPVGSKLRVARGSCTITTHPGAAASMLGCNAPPERTRSCSSLRRSAVEAKMS